MTAPRFPPPPDEWGLLCQMLRRYAIRKYGQLPLGFRLCLPAGDTHQEPIPPEATQAALPFDQAPMAGCPGASREWASGAVPKLSRDGRRCYWPGLGEYQFAPKQAAVVRALWQAQEECESEVEDSALLAAADSDSGRLTDLFKRHPAWGALILPGGRPGTRTLPERPDRPHYDPEDDD